MAVKSEICNFGWNAIDFKLLSIDDNYYSLNELKGKKGLLIMFICNHCPYVQAIAKKISYETDQLNKIGVNSVAIMPNDVSEYPEDSYENMKIFAKNNLFNFHYLFDEKQIIAKSYDAKCTPDFFGFNKNLELQYRGRLDSAGKNINQNEVKRELFNAMKQISISDKGPKEQFSSIGCSIKWKNNE